MHGTGTFHGEKMFRQKAMLTAGVSDKNDAAYMKHALAFKFKET